MSGDLGVRLRVAQWQESGRQGCPGERPRPGQQRNERRRAALPKHS